MKEILMILVLVSIFCSAMTAAEMKVDADPILKKLYQEKERLEKKGKDISRIQKMIDTLEAKTVDGKIALPREFQNFQNSPASAPPVTPFSLNGQFTHMDFRYYCDQEQGVQYIMVYDNYQLIHMTPRVNKKNLPVTCE